MSRIKKKMRGKEFSKNPQSTFSLGAWATLSPRMIVELLRFITDSITKVNIT